MQSPNCFLEPEKDSTSPKQMILDSAATTETQISDTKEEDLQSDQLEVPGIFRRNGFKKQGQLSPKTLENQKKRTESKAHNLWVNYGRKIVDYAINQTRGFLQVRVRQFVGKLTTKKDYLDVFGVK